MLAERARARAGLRRREPATTADLARLCVGRYDAVNIKLDKTGGLTEALAHARAARGAGLQASWSADGRRRRSPWRRRCCWPRTPTGSTSTGRCCWRRDREPGLDIEDGVMSTADPPELWG